MSSTLQVESYSSRIGRTVNLSSENTSAEGKRKHSATLFSFHRKKEIYVSVLVISLIAAAITALALGVIFGPVAGILEFSCGALVGGLIGYSLLPIEKKNNCISASKDVSDCVVEPDTDDEILDRIDQNLGIPLDSEFERRLEEKEPDIERILDRIDQNLGISSKSESNNERFS